MRPAKTKPKGLTSVLRDMVDYRPEICRIQVMDVNAPDFITGPPQEISKTPFTRIRFHFKKSKMVIKSIGQLRLF